LKAGSETRVPCLMTITIQANNVSKQIRLGQV